MDPTLRAALVPEGTGAAVVGALGEIEGAAFLERLELVVDDLLHALHGLYADAGDVVELARTLLDDCLRAAVERPTPLRVLDRRREVDPSWFLREDMVGYACYADRFAGDLAGVSGRLGHLRDLGVRYLHLLPVMRPREGADDGGYAVADYTRVDPRLGEMSDLQDLATELHEHDMVLCLDLVLNHTADEHEWARRAAAGDPKYQDFYLFFPDRTLPDAYERHLPDIFPQSAPGSFTRLPDGRWVWTTFRPYQWDLNWANPAVFRAMLDVMLDLGNRGVDVLRLDAVPLLWKQLGTDCRNLPETHLVLQALRALTRLAMPGLLLVAEAIVDSDDLVPYLGGHERFRPECDLAYDHHLMMLLWSSLATRDVRLAQRALGRRPPAPPGRGWLTYVRCHDDIVWTVSDEDARAVGLDPGAHRRFLTEFYAGRHPGSFAGGHDFELDAGTGTGRTCGTAASLAGLGRAVTDGTVGEVDAALRRLELLYAVAFSFGGIPLVQMGDELALLDDQEWAADPTHADDGRWVHRPAMDWDAAAAQDGSPAARAHRSMRALAEARRRLPALRSDGTTRLLVLDSPHVLAYLREHPRHAPVLVLACFSDDDQLISPDLLAAAGLPPRVVHAHSTTGTLETVGDHLRLPAWGFVWLTVQADTER